MTVEQVIPEPARISLHDKLAELTAPRVPMAPFAPEVIDFCADFSQRLFRDRDSSRFPELQALAFWMRRTAIVRMAEDFASLKRSTVLVPRGLVFHVPPANVDTIFVYSWLVSVLTGNRNIVRLSPRVSEQTAAISRVFNETIANAPASLRNNTVMLRYGHEREITAAISAACDVRVLWGGDASVNSLRSIPIPPHARELTFPDRYSFSLIRASAFAAAPQERRLRLAADFFNDTFWFDQMACSSPRLLVWLGDAGETAQASAELLELVAAHARQKGYVVQPQTRLSRFSFACRAVLDETAAGYQDRRELIVLDLASSERFSREHCGGGLLFQHRISSLSELESFVVRRDQTLTTFGFEPDELAAFALRLNGLDRMVPIGQALSFNRFWDGCDLFQELTRHVYIA